MGVLSGKDVYSKKYITAEITDSSSRLYFVPIKSVIGDYFLADLDHKLYCFEIDGTRIKTHTHKGIRSFRVLQYDTNHYLPLAPEDTKALSDVLKQNDLPKVNGKLLRVFKLLGEREKEATDFEPHDILKLIKEIGENEDQYGETINNLQTYLKNINVKKIITPVRGISDYIEGDLKTTDPKFLGDIVSTLARVDFENKKITNSPITGKFPWIKIMLVTTIIIAIAAIGFWAWSSGMFSGGFSLPGINFGELNTQQLLEQYPTPESLKAAIDRGEVEYDKLPKELKDVVNSVKLPSLQPNP